MAGRQIVSELRSRDAGGCSRQGLHVLHSWTLYEHVLNFAGHLVPHI